MYLDISIMVFIYGCGICPLVALRKNKTINEMPIVALYWNKATSWQVYKIHSSLAIVSTIINASKTVPRCN